jgi:hypothetical protein
VNIQLSLVTNNGSTPLLRSSTLPGFCCRAAINEDSEAWRAMELDLHESPFTLRNTEKWTQDYAVMFYRNGYSG